MYITRWGHTLSPMRPTITISYQSVDLTRYVYNKVGPYLIPHETVTISYQSVDLTRYVYNKVGPYFIPHGTYRYYQLPVCRPDKYITLWGHTLSPMRPVITISYQSVDLTRYVYNKVGPYFNPHETYHYYQLPVCRPDKVLI